MTDSYQLGMLAAFGTGILFAIVTTGEGILGKALGSINASILEHIFSGIIALVLLVGFLLSGKMSLAASKSNLLIAAALGLLVFLAVTGIAYAVPRVGFATGTFLMVSAQITAAVLIDAVGVGGFERIPISSLRLVGLLFMGLGVYFVIPK